MRTPFGEFALGRYPARPREQLQAWCAADELLLAAVATTTDGRDRATLAVNDEHGALALPLGAVASWTDSALSALALAQNCRVNALPSIPVRYATEPPPPGMTRVVMRVPKQLAYFEYQLATLAAALPAGAELLVGGMDKHLSPHTAAMMERYVGTTERHPGRRKARLFSATFNGPLAPPPAAARYRCAPLGAELEAQANVFSRDQLDRGSELLIAQLPGLGRGLRVADLACGNGVLGLAALDGGLAREVLFCDESSMAVASAWSNLHRLRPDDVGHCEQHLGDGLRDYPGAPFDLVLCNPPFHLQHTVDDYAGRRLLSQAAGHLSAQGRLCLVANRHLRYRPALARDFARVEQLAQNNKFTVWLASGPKHGPR